MPGHDIIVIGFSAGGVEPLQRLVAGLPRDLPAAVFIVHHFPSTSISALAGIVSRAGPLPALQPADGDPVVPGRIYVARTDHHLLLRGDQIRLTQGPREQGHRPAIDPLFRTAAESFGSRVVGVILSGTLDDGTAGLLAIKEAGGLAVVQDPEDAVYPGMVLSAIQNVPVDHVARAEDLGPLLQRLARLPAGPSRQVMPPVSNPGRRLDAKESVDLADEIDPAEGEPSVSGTAALRHQSRRNHRSPVVRPDCGGVLAESEHGKFLHFRCHVGHAYSAESLFASQSDAIEAALWTAVRALEEKAELARRLAERSGGRGLHKALAQFERAARDAEDGSDTIRQTLLTGPVRHAIESPSEALNVNQQEHHAHEAQLREADVG